MSNIETTKGGEQKKWKDVKAYQYPATGIHRTKVGIYTTTVMY